MDKPDNTSIEICKKIEYLGTHSLRLFKSVEIVEKEIDPDLVEVIVSYKVEPNNENLLLENTKFFFDEEDGSYYLVDDSGEPGDERRNQPTGIPFSTAIET